MRLTRPLPLLLSVSILVLGGCRSAQKLMLAPAPQAFQTQLPALDITVENGPMDKTEGALQEDPMQVFRRQTSQGLLEKNDSSATFGSLKLQILEAKATRQGKGLHAIQMMGFLTPSLLGIPLEFFRTHVRAQVQVIDALGNVIGTYEGTGDSRIKVAMYHGYSQGSAPRLADTEALKSALAKIRPQLDTATALLRTRLLTSGPMGPQETEVATGGLYGVAPAEATNSEDQ